MTVYAIRNKATDKIRLVDADSQAAASGRLRCRLWSLPLGSLMMKWRGRRET